MATHKQSVSRDETQRAMREASELPQPSIVDLDPEDPSQLLDDAGQYQIVDLEVEAQPQAEADAELDAAVEATSEVDTPQDTTADAYAEEADDTGELYGVHTPRAVDRDFDKTSDQEEFADSSEGENWLETLGKQAAEGGVAAEEELDVVDDNDGHHSTESGDRPVADKGSGGDAGL